MDLVSIADLSQKNREELIILVFELFYPNSKIKYNKIFIDSLLYSSVFIKQIYNNNNIDPYNFDKEFGCGTFQELVDCLREKNGENYNLQNIIDNFLSVKID